MTQVTVINGSPKTEKGNTARVLVPFIEGMREAGAEVELVYSKKMKIRSCIGEFDCWYKKIGECIHTDDMDGLYPKLKASDILVLATPIYIPLPGEIQNLINRLCPLVEPILEFRDGRTRARFHKDVRISKIALVGSGGWWELGNFETLVRIVEELALNTSVEFAGAVLRPHAILMKEENEKTRKVDEAIKTAGRQLIQQGKMDEEVLKRVSEPLISENDYRAHQNRGYEAAKNR